MSRQHAGFLGFLLMALVGLAWAAVTPSRPGPPAPRSGQVIFYTDPPFAKIIQERPMDPRGRAVLGLSNRDAITFPDGIDPSRDYPFVFLKEGFESAVTIPGSQLKSGVWPDPQKRSHKLEPNGLWPWLGQLWDYRRPQVLLALVGGAGTLVFLWTLVLETRRQRALERYRAAAGTDPHVGAQISDYRVVEFIDSGAFGTVYRCLPAASLDERRSMAMKIVKPPTGEADSPVEEMRRRFDREMRLCSKLDHPNIVKVLDYGETPDFCYTVMEYVPGRSFKSLLGEDPSLERLMALTKQVAGALTYAHEQGVIHRDLKPDNIRVTDTGQVKLLDFGLAREEGKDDITRSGVAVGTVAYMAPEQLAGTPPTPAVDQYALGLMIYETLAGALPYDTGDVAQLINHRLLAGYVCPPLEAKRSDLAPQICQVVNRMLAVEREQRFASVSEAIQALEEAVAEVTAAKAGHL